MIKNIEGFISSQSALPADLAQNFVINAALPTFTQSNSPLINIFFDTRSLLKQLNGLQKDLFLDMYQKTDTFSGMPMDWDGV